jgi:hypothetical protein
MRPVCSHILKLCGIVTVRWFSSRGAQKSSVSFTSVSGTSGQRLRLRRRGRRRADHRTRDQHDQHHRRCGNHSSRITSRAAANLLQQDDVRPIERQAQPDDAAGPLLDRSRAPSVLTAS